MLGTLPESDTPGRRAPIALPALPGTREALLAGIDLPALGYECAEQVAGERALHVFLRKRA